MKPSFVQPSVRGIRPSVRPRPSPTPPALAVGAAGGEPRAGGCRWGTGERCWGRIRVGNLRFLLIPAAPLHAHTCQTAKKWPQDVCSKKPSTI